MCNITYEQKLLISKRFKFFLEDEYLIEIGELCALECINYVIKQSNHKKEINGYIDNIIYSLRKLECLQKECSFLYFKNLHFSYCRDEC